MSQKDRFRSAPKAVLSLLIVMTLLLAMLPHGVAQADAGNTNMDIHAAVLSLQAYGIVDQKPESELRLSDSITRAEVAKILVAALNLKSLADASGVQPAFPDTAGHWGNGWIAVAKSRGLFQGRPDGNFDPNASVTYAEVFTALLRLTGRGQDASRSWPLGAIATSVQLGIIPPDLGVHAPYDQVATRGDVFRITAIAIGRVPMANAGQTLLQALFDDLTPPALVLSGFPRLTDQGQVVVTGQAKGAATLFVAGQAANLLADGSFTAQLNLQAGDNKIDVLAMDGAGNRAEASTTITYARMSRIAIDPPVIETAAGQPFAVPVLRYDTAGHATPATGVAWGYDTSAVTWDERTGMFTASQSGQYTIHAMLDGYDAEATVIVAGDPVKLDMQVDHSTLVAGGMPTAVHIRVVDAQGRLNTAGSRMVQFSVAPSGTATLDNAMLTITRGQGTIYLAPGMTPGAVGLQASVTGSTTIAPAMMPLNIEQRQLAGFQLQTVPANVEPTAGHRVKIIATAVDQMGTPIQVSDDTTVNLRSGNPGVLGLLSATAVIRAGSASSDYGGGQDGVGYTGGNSGTATVDGLQSFYPVTSAKVTAASGGAITGLQATVEQDTALSDGLSATVVSVSRVDANGVVVGDSSTPVVLVTPTNGVSITPIGDTGGTATFAVRSMMQGRVNLVAGVPGHPEMNSAPVTVAFVRAVAPSGRPILKGKSNIVTAGDATSFYMVLQDNMGKPMANPGPPLIFRLSASNGATMTAAEAVIPPGATRSDDIIVNVPASANFISITGALIGSQQPIPPLSISALPPIIGQPGQNLPGPHLVVLPPGGGRDPVAGEDTKFVVQERNGDKLVTTGSFAFELQAVLDGKVLDEYPDNLTIRLGKLSMQQTTGRTSQGQAEIWVNYTGAGKLELRPVPASANGAAHDQWGVSGYASSTIGQPVVSSSVTYDPAPLDHLVASVDESMGDPLVGVIRAARGRMATVRLRPVDKYGNQAGTTDCVASLTRLAVTPVDGQAIRAGGSDLPESAVTLGTDGTAQFQIFNLSSEEGVSTWAPQVTCGNTTLALDRSIRIYTTLNEAPTPEIEFAGGDVSGESGVHEQDTQLVIRIKQTNVPTGSSAELLVYDSTDLIGRFGPIDPGSPIDERRTIRIPKEELGDSYRTLTLRVRLNTGADVSDFSTYEPVWVEPRDLTP